MSNEYPFHKRVDRFALWIALGFPIRATRQRSAPACALFVTGPPWSPFLLGALVARVFRIPLVLDYRDSWNGIPGIAGKAGVPEALEFIGMVGQAQAREEQVGASALLMLQPGSETAAMIEKNRLGRNLEMFSGFDPEAQDARMVGHLASATRRGAMCAIRHPLGTYGPSPP